MRMALVAFGFAALMAEPAMAGGNANGTWIMDSGKVTVRISDCGGKLCGTIVGLRRPLDRNGRPKLDKENPDAALRGRPVIGLTILNGLHRNGDDRWVGTIYNPDDGYTYKSKLKLVDDRTMRVKGCFAFICKTMKFNRVN